MNAKKSQMMASDLLQGFAEYFKGTDVAISDLSLDNRQTKAGDLFLACRGASVHGVKFLPDAIAAGAVAVAIETDSEQEFQEIANKHPSIAVFAVSQLTQHLGAIAAKFYGNPSQKLRLVGITGTNGKTSCAHLLAQCLDSVNMPCGIMGTLGAGLWGNTQPITHTTPNAVDVQRWLWTMLNQKAAYVAMEVSSHGLEQGRINACSFEIAVFTNLTRDHLDYHGDIQSYGNSKLRLFQRPELTKVVVNLDDPYSLTIIEQLADNVEVVGVTLDPTLTVEGVKVVLATEIILQNEGLAFNLETPWGKVSIQSKLLGNFNVSNLLCVISVALLLDIPLRQIVEKIKTATAPAGRLETFVTPDSPLVVVDYAHTPDALEQALLTLQEYAKGKLFVLFGCGGDRDQGKRAEMGALAEQLADVIWLTDDNPRTEKSEKIIGDILTGVQNPQAIHVESDRKRAIEKVISAAKSKDDVVLIAGKGHEDYQIIGEKCIEFSDRELVAKLVGEAA